MATLHDHNEGKLSRRLHRLVAIGGWLPAQEGKDPKNAIPFS